MYLIPGIVLSRLYIWISMCVVMVACGQSLRAQATRDDVASFAEWAARDQLLPVPVLIDLEITRRSEIAAEEIERELEAYRDLPDHPDRQELEIRRGLARDPEVRRFRLALSPSGAWSYEELNDPIKLKAGGLGRTRWMDSTIGAKSQRVLIREGIPYPAMYDVGRLRSGMQRYIDLVLRFGLWRDVQMARIEVEGGVWHADIHPRDGGPPLMRRIFGGFVGGRAVVERIETLLGENENPQSALLLGDFREVALGNESLLVPFMWEESGSVSLPGVVSEGAVLAIQVVGSAEVERMAAVPDTDTSGFQVLDFREPGAVELLGFSGSPTHVWKRGVDGPVYEVVRAGDAEAPLGRVDPVAAVSSGGSVVRTVVVLVLVSVLVAGVLIVLRKNN